ncbi:hypothetical protein CDAR_304551 [Caerostris darwini]|uniref:Uncharacterized protein n=1 Tax=Caerostris darwini TaxID=1538125 RepID=A0AAV4NJI7_9ARAC|nr:hypothetical protein CDAR_304551 [Caerostris darwini]
MAPLVFEPETCDIERQTLGHSGPKNLLSKFPKLSSELHHKTLSNILTIKHPSPLHNKRNRISQPFPRTLLENYTPSKVSMTTIPSYLFHSRTEFRKNESPESHRHNCPEKERERERTKREREQERKKRKNGKKRAGTSKLKVLRQFDGQRQQSLGCRTLRRFPSQLLHPSAAAPPPPLEHPFLSYPPFPLPPRKCSFCYPVFAGESGMKGVVNSPRLRGKELLHPQSKPYCEDYLEKFNKSNMGTLFHSHKIPRNFSRKETPYPPPTNSLKTGPSNPPRSEGDGGGGTVLREQWKREGGSKSNQ